MCTMDISATILSALLTCGILMIFVENQHISGDIYQYYIGVMKPFMHRLSNYFKYLSCVKPTCFEKVSSPTVISQYQEEINIL